MAPTAPSPPRLLTASAMLPRVRDVGKFISKKRLSDDVAALAVDQKEAADAIAALKSKVEGLSSVSDKSDEREPPRALWAPVGVIAVFVALALVISHFVYAQDAGRQYRTLADVIGAVLVVLSVVAQSVLVILDAWGVSSDNRLRANVSVFSIASGLVGGIFVVIGALNAHGL